jgi:hypothetical protein
MSTRNYISSLLGTRRNDSGNTDHKATNELPEIPKGNLSGLKAIYGKFYRTQNLQSTQMSTFNQLESRDESYHEILRANV